MTQPPHGAPFPRRAARALLCAGAGLVLILPACRTGDSAGSGPDRPVAFEMRVVESTEGKCGEGAASACARFRVEYPEITRAPNADALAALNQAVRWKLLKPELWAPAPSPQDMADFFFAQWRGTRAAFPDAASTAGWFLDIRLRVIHQDHRLISLESAEQAYTGGAHPNSATRYSSFDLSDGRPLTLDDLLLDGRSAKLNEIAERRFRELHEVPQERSLADAGFWFEGGAFALNDNFAVTDAGLLFRFDPYEVAAYALGPTELLLTPEDLEGLVLPGGPLDRSD